MRFWDTSALLSLVLKDEHHRKACQWLTNEAEPHITTSLATFEAENRLHVLHLTGKLKEDEHQQRLTALRLLISSNLIVEKLLRDTRSLSAECRRLISASRPAYHTELWMCSMSLRPGYSKLLRSTPSMPINARWR